MKKLKKISKKIGKQLSMFSAADINGKIAKFVTKKKKNKKKVINTKIPPNKPLPIPVKKNKVQDENIKIEDNLEINIEQQIEVKEEIPFIEEEKKYIAFQKDDIKRQRDIEDEYLLENELGRGAFAVVRKARFIKTGENVAVKIIDKRLVKLEETKLLIREIFIMTNLSHVAILKVFDVFEDDIYIYIVMELLNGGTLFNRIMTGDESKNKKEGCLNEIEGRWICYQVLSALYYLHSKVGVAHRDIKPENILMVGDVNCSCRLADFGLAKVFTQEPLKTACGTQEYAAPEILMGQPEYSYQVDIWSLGVQTYVSLCGYHPFDGDSLHETVEQMLSGEVIFDDEEWGDISLECKDFIVKCLAPDPTLRMNAQQALQHPWFNGITPPVTEFGIVEQPPVIPVTEEELANARKNKNIKSKSSENIKKEENPKTNEENIKSSTENEKEEIQQQQQQNNNSNNNNLHVPPAKKLPPQPPAKKIPPPPPQHQTSSQQQSSSQRQSLSSQPELSSSQQTSTQPVPPSPPEKKVPSQPAPISPPQHQTPAPPEKKIPPPPPAKKLPPPPPKK